MIFCLSVSDPKKKFWLIDIREKRLLARNPNLLCVTYCGKIHILVQRITEKKTSACFVKLSIKRVVHLTNLSRKDTKFHWGETKYHKLSHLLQYFFCRCKALVSQTVGLHKIKWSLYYAVVSQSNWPEWAITQHYSSLLGTELRWIDRSMSPHQLFSLKVIWFRSARIKLAAFQAPQGLFSRYTMVAFSNPKLRCFPL